MLADEEECMVGILLVMMTMGWELPSFAVD